MSIAIDGHFMVTTFGLCNAVQQADDSWRVAFAPELVLDRNQAISALMIADHLMMADMVVPLPTGTVHGCDGHCRMWPAVVQWASEIGMTGEQACKEIEKFRATWR